MNVITNISQLDLNESYSYADYLSWKFKERVELIKGKIFKMGPAPNLVHQSILRQISGYMWEVFKNTNCKYFVAPFDVRLYKKNKSNHQVKTVVQPDICIVYDPKKLDGAGCLGAPDLVVEILSPGNSVREMNVKFDLYQENGVREYWIVDPMHQIINMFILENGKYVGQKPYTIDSSIKSKLFTKLKIALTDIFNY